MIPSFTNMAFSICEVIESGDRVNVRVLFTAVHANDLNVPGFCSIPASNKFFRAHSSATYHFTKEGRIVEVHMISTLTDSLKAVAAASGEATKP